MRTKLFIALILCLAFAGRAEAQRYLPGQRGIELRGGLSESFSLSREAGQGYYGGIALSTYNKKGNRWVFGGEYLQKLYGYRDMLIPVSQFTAEGGYYLKFLSDPSKTVFLSIGGSAMAGYEVRNWGERMLFDGSMITGKDSFLYGGAVTFEVETFITDRIIFLLNARERILWGSSVGNFRFQAGIGIKFIIN